MKAAVQKIQGWLQEVSVPQPAFTTEITDWKQKNMHNGHQHNRAPEHKKEVSGERIQARAIQPEVKINRAQY